MNYNLTENQKQLAQWLVEKIRSGELRETFKVRVTTPGMLVFDELGGTQGAHQQFDLSNITPRTFEALAADGLVLVHIQEAEFLSYGGGHKVQTDYEWVVVTARGQLYKAVDTRFAEEAPTAAPVSTLAFPHPPEISHSIDRLRKRYPDPTKVGFLVMRFTAAKPFARIVEIIKQTAAQHALEVIRADENEFHADLWGNVRTHLHGCGYGIAVYERIETDEPNANVGLEVGYLMAMNKPVLLLKDKTLPVLQADLAGKLYKSFDPHAPEDALPAQLTKWLEDNGIIVPGKS